jgi:hypothetical protein
MCLRAAKFFAEPRHDGKVDAFRRRIAVASRLIESTLQPFYIPTYTGEFPPQLMVKIALVHCNNEMKIGRALGYETAIARERRGDGITPIVS